MNDIKNVASRLKGLRDALEMSAEEVATKTRVSLEQYQLYESGEVDIPVSYLRVVATEFEIEVETLLFGNEPKMKSYFVTRKGCGEKVNRTSYYSYQSLSAGFVGNIMHPFLVTIEPGVLAKEPNTHSGQEWNYVLEGEMEIEIDGKPIVLEAGDAISFDATKPHRMRALGGHRAVMIAIIA